jgi:glucose/mannose-6-phosphate isomerase
MQSSDQSNFYQFICDFPKQIESSYHLLENLDFKRYKISYENIVIAGMGGSAIAGDLLQAYLKDDINLPIIVSRNYSIPTFVSSKTLFIACSYSGNTEETLQSYKKARQKKAKTIGIASGGTLNKLASRSKIPFIQIPGGYPPRQALGYMFFALIHLFENLGLIKTKEKEIKETIKMILDIRERNHPKTTHSHNFCNHVAQKLYKKIPVIYSASEYLNPIVTRWRNQLNENAKILSFSNVFPELNHNEIMGWEGPKDLLRDFSIIFLRDSSEHPRNQKRLDITKEILQRNRFQIFEVFSEGNSLLSRIISLIYIGDWVSYYLALLYDKDPYRIDSINFLKDALIQFDEGTKEK